MIIDITTDILDRGYNLTALEALLYNDLDPSIRKRVLRLMNFSVAAAPPAIVGRYWRVGPSACVPACVRVRSCAPAFLCACSCVPVCVRARPLW